MLKLRFKKYRDGAVVCDFNSTMVRLRSPTTIPYANIRYFFI